MATGISPPMYGDSALPKSPRSHLFYLVILVFFLHFALFISPLHTT